MVFADRVFVSEIFTVALVDTRIRSVSSIMKSGEERSGYENQSGNKRVWQNRTKCV